MQIKYVKTIIGWYNVYINNELNAFNMPPHKFFEIFPQVSRKATLSSRYRRSTRKNRIKGATNAYSNYIIYD